MAEHIYIVDTNILFKYMKSLGIEESPMDCKVSQNVLANIYTIFKYKKICIPDVCYREFLYNIYQKYLDFENYDFCFSQRQSIHKKLYSFICNPENTNRIFYYRLDDERKKSRDKILEKIPECIVSELGKFYSQPKKNTNKQRDIMIILSF